jgi:phosphoribosyl 1,2-cyclic phosphodiesterase
MSLFVSSLNSGSNGNCYYIGSNENAILIDGGISCRETEKRLKRLGLNIRRIRAIFVSHEHGDHVHGIPTISKKYKVPVYITPETLRHGNLEIQTHLINPFKAYETINIGDISVTPFPKLHDASDPHSFVIASHNVKVGVFTDIGFPCEHVRKNFSECHAVFLEANYDESMLEHGSYPYPLKNRIRGGKGHLSNVQALNLFNDHRPPFMTHLFLSHLSRENNRPRIVQDLFKKIATATQIVIATRKKETPLYHIRNTMPLARSSQRYDRSNFQLSLFQQS